MPQKFFGLDYKMMSPLCVSMQKDVKAPADQVRVLWMMETLISPVSIMVWVVQLCCIRLFWGKTPEFPMGQIPMGQQCYVK